MYKTNDKGICSFFASDYHFEMITLPYIEKELENKKKVFIFTENDLNSTIETLLSNVNLSEDKKQRIKSINWNKDDLNKLKEVEKIKDNMTIFIKGNEIYINDIRKKLDNVLNNGKVSFIDCYDINCIESKVSDISENYSSILNTIGKIQK